MKQEPQKTVKVTIPQELYDTVKKMAKETCRTVPSYIRIILRDHIGQKP